MIIDLDTGSGGSRRLRPAQKMTDTANHFAVGVKGDEVVILRPKCGPMSKAEAANLAKWLHVLSEESTADFARGVQEIRK